MKEAVLTSHSCGHFPFNHVVSLSVQSDATNASFFMAIEVARSALYGTPRPCGFPPLCLSNDTACFAFWLMVTFISPRWSTSACTRKGSVESITLPWPYHARRSGSAIGPPMREKQPLLSQFPEP